MENHTVPLTRGALLAALSVLFGLGAVYLPLIGALLTLVFAVPLIILTKLHGLSPGIMASLVTVLLLGLLMEPLIAVRLGVAFIPPALVIGVGFHREWSAPRTFISAFLVSTLSKVASIALIFAITDVNPMEMELGAIKESFQAAFHTYEAMGVDGAALDEARKQIDDSMSLVNILIPTIILLMGLLDTAVAYMTANGIMRRMGLAKQKFPPFSEWRLPVGFLYLMGFAMVGIYWGSTREMEWLYVLSMNANILALFAGLLQGFSLIAYVGARYRIGKVWQGFFMVLIMMNGILAQVTAFAGLFDMAFDYRRRFSQR